MIARREVPPKDFAKACRTLQEDHGVDTLVDPDDVGTIANLYPRYSMTEVAERLGKDPDKWSRWTPSEMQHRINALKTRGDQ